MHNNSFIGQLANVFTVSSLAMEIRNCLELRFLHIKVKGEIIQPKQYASGLYFTLKDNLSILDCVIWSNTKVPFTPKEGDEVICTGRITIYAGRSKYQMSVNNIEYAGLGLALKIIEERRKKLAAEGLFNKENRLKLPKIPWKIGIITSPNSAVIHDMLHRLEQRHPLPVLLYPVTVQGPDMPLQVTAGIKYLSNCDIDLIILARGGGSFEDLLGFNDEQLVRAVAGTKKPIITAIGHETDTTLVDYASSLRAPTPSAAIELCTPNRKDLNELLTTLTNNIESKFEDKIKLCQSIIERINMHTNSFTRFLYQKLDYTINDFETTLGQRIQVYKQRIANLSNNYSKPKFSALQNKITSIDDLRRNITRYTVSQYELKIQSLNDILIARAANNGSCIAVVNNRLIRNKQEAITAKRFSLHFIDGLVEVKVVE